MPSRTEGLLLTERGLRALALGAIAVTLLRLVAAAGAEREGTHARFDVAPSPLTRDSLGAAARSGERVTWSGDVAAVAAMAEGVRDPRPAVRVSTVADSGALIADTLGALDSLGAGGGTLTVALGGEEADDAPSAMRDLRVTERGTTARAGAPVTAAPGRILVLGRAGWEAKFVVAALEEAGWRVDARLRLSDTMQVAQGMAGAPAPGTHAAVVVLDSVVGTAAAGITRFVRAGGGLILAGDGSRAAGLSGIAPARAMARLALASRTFDDVDPLDALPLHPLATPRADAIVLELREQSRAIAARREGMGRVVQSGFAETWRWRMEGGPGSVGAHRDWWSRLVALAVPTASSPRRMTTADEGAPRAALEHALGPPSEAARDTKSRAPLLPAWLGALILTLLVAEWGMRRTRGVA